MSLIRFATARDLYEAFSTAQDDIEAEPSDAAPLDFLRTLSDGGEWKKAVSFCAYLLPRREAVWWACRSTRRLVPKLVPAEQAGLQAAEEWVKAPEEERRVAALGLGMRSDFNWPTTWLALAAGWSGGNMALDAKMVAPPPPQQTARAVRAAVLSAVARVAPLERTAGLRACVEDARRIAAEEVA